MTPNGLLGTLMLAARTLLRTFCLGARGADVATQDVASEGGLTAVWEVTVIVIPSAVRVETSAALALIEAMAVASHAQKKRNRAIPPFVGNFVKDSKD